MLQGNSLKATAVSPGLNSRRGQGRGKQADFTQQLRKRGRELHDRSHIYGRHELTYNGCFCVRRVTLVEQLVRECVPMEKTFKKQLDARSSPFPFCHSALA
jgi:hypothetical protein